MAGASEVSQLLAAVRAGVDGAEDELMRGVYEDLRSLAARFMANVPPTDTLQPTALVNECYLRLVEKSQTDWQSARHFFALAARAMHDIIVEQARRHLSLKRGGDRRRVALDDPAIDLDAQASDLVALSEALRRLTDDDALAAEIVMLRYFGGLSHEQASRVLDVPVIRVRREWAYAKAFLHRDMTAGDTS